MVPRASTSARKLRRGSRSRSRRRSRRSSRVGRAASYETEPARSIDVHCRYGKNDEGVLKTALVMITALATATSGPQDMDSTQREARRVFESYIAARNRHDPEALAAFTDRNIRAFDAEGKPHPFDLKRLRNVLAWEGVMNARWKGKVVGWDGTSLEVEASEENDLFDALRIGAAVQRDRIRVEHGRIVEWRGLSERT